MPRSPASKSPATKTSSYAAPEGGARVVWKGAISFGLVHVPVGVHTASTSTDVDFDWLDKRSMEPVGYKRINKKTGEDIDQKDIVKGIAIANGKYVVLSSEEIEAAFPKATQTIEIESFVDEADVPFLYMERPYYLAPIGKGEKVYALLREALVATGKVGVAKVVMHSKQHLALLIPSGPVLVLNLMRWGGEIKPIQDLHLPPQGVEPNQIKPAEMAMAKQLITEMSTAWNPDDFRDSFRDAIMQLVERKTQAGEVSAVEQLEQVEGDSAEIIDLSELLKRSLKGKKTNAASASETAPPLAPTSATDSGRKTAARKGGKKAA